MGITDSDLKKFKAVMERAPGAIEYLCIDVANGYTEIFVDFVSKIREEFPHLAIMAGNVVTGDMTEELILAGADIVKVGIGPGLRLHHAQDDRRRLSSALRHYRVR